MPREQRMDERKLLALLEAEEQDAVGYYRGEVAADQEQALEYYYANPFGDEVDGRSQVVSQDVRESVEWLMPDMARIFMSGGHVAEFSPADTDIVENDEKLKQLIQDAEDATEYCNRVFRKDNPGFRLWHDWGKDGLIQKVGVMRVDWEEPDWMRPEHHTNLSTSQLAELHALEEAGKAEILDHEERQLGPDELTQETAGVFFDGFAHDVKFRRMRPYGRVVIAPLAPEEFLLRRASRSLEDARYRAHRTYKTLSELMEEFPDHADQLWEELPTDEDEELDTRKETRFDDEDFYPGDEDPTPLDRASTPIKFLDEYIEVDFDGDGFTELRNVKRAGHIILFNEEVEDDPFVDWCPNRVPHKFYGLSLADDTMDIQRIKSVLWRSALDSTYQQVNGREAVLDGKVNMDDLLTVKAGQKVRVDPTVQDIRNVILPLTGPDVVPSVFSMLEYVDQEAEGRTGISRHSQGLDPDTLNKTATGIQLLQNASNGRKEMIARNMADGMEKLFRKMLRLLVDNDTSARMVRLKNGQFKHMDPSRWSPEMDVQVHVGLGTGSREQQMANLGFILANQKEIMLNAGPDNPLVQWTHLRESLLELTSIAGFKGPDRFFGDPEEWEPLPPQPDPEVQKEMIKAEAQKETKQAELQQRAEADGAKLQQEGILQASKLEAEREEAMLKFQAEFNQLQEELALKWKMFVAELNMKREMHREEMEMKREMGFVAEAGKVEQAKIKTDVKMGGEPG